MNVYANNTRGNHYKNGYNPDEKLRKQCLNLHNLIYALLSAKWCLFVFLLIIGSVVVNMRATSSNRWSTYTQLCISSNGSRSHARLNISQKKGTVIKTGAWVLTSESSDTGSSHMQKIHEREQGAVYV